ncbi:protein transport protein sft2 [Exophiala dermatitidis]|nr:protein transport protein sft2 [Exophiala dermatitidis]KAJ4541643.1 protein transport protein sft2 [Exophiala dermatitidis]
MTTSAFRDSMNSLGWSRRDPDIAANTSSSTPILSRLSSFNPFGQRGYVQLPTHEAPGAPLPAPTRREEEEGWFAFLSLKPRKFAILWSVGSMLFLASWAFMMGPYQYAQHLISGPRLPFTAAYFGSIVMTIYFAVGLHSTILTLLSSIVQLVALAWYLVSYFPMGSTGLRFAARVGGGRVAAWMND